MKRAQTYEEIKPLIDLCRAGRLFDVQEWISEGKPLETPLPEPKKASRRSPLAIAMDTGFHSLVQVLLEGGAALNDPRYNFLREALRKRRLDLFQLLVAHGADIHSVDINEAFDTWNMDIVEFFIQHGISVEEGNPVAYAFCDRIRTALALYMRYKDRYPSLREQANIALRYHCREGNMKWVALMLWAGADPYAKGPSDPGCNPDPDEDSCALELASLFGHFDIFKMKNVHLDPNHETAEEMLRNACRNSNSDFLKMLIDRGFNPTSMEDKGSSLMQLLLLTMSYFSYPYLFSRDDKNIDSSESREKIKMLHMLARKGARWNPADRYDLTSARRSLLKMKPDYTMEFIWIMSEYKACAHEAIEELMRSSAMRALISQHINRYKELLGAFEKA